MSREDNAFTTAIAALIYAPMTAVAKAATTVHHMKEG